MIKIRLVLASIVLFTIGCANVPRTKRDPAAVEGPTSAAVVKEGNSWVSEWIEIEIPKGLSSFQILAVGSPEALLQITDLIDPTGFRYVSSAAGGSTTLSAYSLPILQNVVSPNRSEGVSLGTATLNVPNSLKVPTPRPGKWRLRTHSHMEPINKSVDFYVFFSNGEKRELRANVWISPDSYWAKWSQIDEMLTGAVKIYSDIGINLVFEKTENLPVGYDHLLVLPEEASALAWQQNDPTVVNVYLMPEMEHQNKPVNGLACIGGPSNVHVRHSCFVSMFASSKADTVSTEEKSRILAHEFGHYLGLFHTRDEGYFKIGTMSDPLDDTPPKVTGQNMMDPGVHDKNPKFSAQQIQMINLSPALQ